MAFIGKPIPDFTTPAIMPDGEYDHEFNLGTFIKGKIAIVFFFVMDFSQICPTELVALNNRYEEFKKRDAVVIAVSGDSHVVHKKWRAIEPAQGGIGQFKFPLVADMSRRVGEGYGVCINKSISLRGTFIADKDGIVRHESVNDFQLGRNIDEILRLIDAQIMYEKTGKLSPANWHPDGEAMLPDDKSLISFMGRYADIL